VALAEMEADLNGALDLTSPSDLMAKLEQELGAVSANHGNSYAAINALRDAYHLREWIWHDRLEHNSVLQTQIMGAAGSEDAWNGFINRGFSDFPLVRELCNGSKHFAHNSDIRASHRAGWDSPVIAFDTPSSGWDDNGFHIEVNGRFVPIAGLLERVGNFWRDLFSQFPQLA
jgi:hypothetical protein